MNTPNITDPYVHLQIVKMGNFMLFFFYHESKKKLLTALKGFLRDCILLQMTQTSLKPHLIVTQPRNFICSHSVEKHLRKNYIWSIQFLWLVPGVLSKAKDFWGRKVMLGRCQPSCSKAILKGNFSEFFFSTSPPTMHKGLSSRLSWKTKDFLLLSLNQIVYWWADKSPYLQHIIIVSFAKKD